MQNYSCETKEVPRKQNCLPNKPLIRSELLTYIQTKKNESLAETITNLKQVMKRKKMCINYNRACSLYIATYTHTSM